MGARKLNQEGCTIALAQVSAILDEVPELSVEHRLKIAAIGVRIAESNRVDMQVLGREVQDAVEAD